jgi:hypothetical protein
LESAHARQMPQPQPCHCGAAATPDDGCQLPYSSTRSPTWHTWHAKASSSSYPFRRSAEIKRRHRQSNYYAVQIHRSTDPAAPFHIPISSHRPMAAGHRLQARRLEYSISADTKERPTTAPHPGIDYWKARQIQAPFLPDACHHSTGQRLKMSLQSLPWINQLVDISPSPIP